MGLKLKYGREVGGERDRERRGREIERGGER